MIMLSDLREDVLEGREPRQSRWAVKWAFGFWMSGDHV